MASTKVKKKPYGINKICKYNMYLEKVTCLNHQRRYINDTNQCVDFNHLEHKKVYQIYAGNCFIHHDLLDFIY